MIKAHGGDLGRSGMGRSPQNQNGFYRQKLISDGLTEFPLLKQIRARPVWDEYDCYPMNKVLGGGLGATPPEPERFLPVRK